MFIFLFTNDRDFYLYLQVINSNQGEEEYFPESNIGSFSAIIGMILVCFQIILLILLIIVINVHLVCMLKTLIYYYGI